MCMRVVHFCMNGQIGLLIILLFVEFNPKIIPFLSKKNQKKDFLSTIQKIIFQLILNIISCSEAE